jgi:hypothetical protein
MVRRILTITLVFGLTAGFGLAQAPQYSEPAPMAAQPSPDELRTAILEVQESLCSSIQFAAQTLMQTGTLASAIPVVMEMTGLQPADIELKEQAVCKSDPSTLTLEQLRANNRVVVWLLEVHMAALQQVTTP